MKLEIVPKITCISMLLLCEFSIAFHVTRQFRTRAIPMMQHHLAAKDGRRYINHSSSLLAATVKEEVEPTAIDKADRLKSMAAALRAEVADLEAKKEEATAETNKKLFNRFDINNDGEVTLEELKSGLEKLLKTTEEIPEYRIQQLLNAFDTNGDGVLQLEEFVSVERFRNQLDQLSREEKEAARRSAHLAKKEEEAAQKMEMVLTSIKDSINNKEPTNVDKVLSVLPYLLPLLDALPLGEQFLTQYQNNPLVAGLGALFVLYRSIPFGGITSFLILSALGNNLSINRLIRFNMKQAILLDISLIIPSLIFSLVGLLSGESSSGITELGNSAVFVTTLLAIAYASVSSLLGITPDQLPFVSKSISRQMPTIEIIMQNRGDENSTRTD